MTRPIRPGVSPKRRSGSTHPAPVRPPVRRRPAARRPATRASGVAIPSTVWTCGITPIDSEATWPVQLVGKIVRAFSPPGGRVLVLPWPRRTGSRRDRDLAATLQTINDLGRTCEVVHLRPVPPVPIRGLGHGPSARSGPRSEPGSRPFWADLFGEPEPQTTPAPPRKQDSGEHADADLIITSLQLQPGHADALEMYRDPVALTAARKLQVGGILAVLTHCDRSNGVLADPTGPIVASAQNADLLYLQHIVALHHPIRNGQLAPEPGDAAAGDSGGTATPHRRISSDLLVFAQPRDHQPPPAAPTAAPDMEAQR